MSAPRSVVRINRDGVQYVSSVDKANYYIYELSRAALRDVGKFVKKKFRENFYKKFRRHTGLAGNAVTCVVLSNKKTTDPRVEIGWANERKKKKQKGFYAFFQETGTKKTPKLAILTRSVEDNIPEIIRIESQYLSALESEARALSLINEDDYDDEEDEL